jgi:PhnB protein
MFSLGGRCEEALEFYRTALGAGVGMMMRFKESPEPTRPGMVGPGWEEKVMHASFKIGASELMASDGCPGEAGFNLKSEVDRGDLIQSAGREGHSSELTVSFDTLSSSSRPIGSAPCISSSPPTSEFRFKGFPLSLTFPNEAEAKEAFEALAEGGEVRMPLGKTFWSPCFGMVEDRFGMGWMVTVAG